MLVSDYQVNPRNFFMNDGSVFVSDVCEKTGQPYCYVKMDTTHKRFKGVEPIDGQYALLLDHIKLKRDGFLETYGGSVLSIQMGEANYVVDQDYEYCRVNIKTGQVYSNRTSFGDYDWKHSRDTYGVADSVSQIYRKYRKVLNNPDYLFIVDVCEVRKDHQPEDGGWRWHKWGTYIGKKEPQCEYLYDEPKIDSVFVFHINVVKKVE